MSYDLSLVIPCFNEGENIRILTKKIDSLLDSEQMHGRFELIFVSDGPAQDFADLLKEVEEQYGFVKVILFPTNKGYGFSILEGLRAAKGEYIGWTHADLQTDPKDVFTALNTIKNSQDPVHTYVKGVRKNRPLFDQVFSFGMGVFESLYLGMMLYEINAQPNIVHRSFLHILRNPPHDFSWDLYTLYSAKTNGFCIKRFDVLFPPRIHGHSNWNTGRKAKWKFIKRTLQFSKKLKHSLRAK